MVRLDVVFWMFVVLFSVIGLNRGWAKELLVTFAVILALFGITVLQQFEPQIIQALAENSGVTLFWFRSVILILLVFFGYQSASIPGLSGSGKFAREKLQDALLGLFLGAFNGFMVVGTIWYFMDVARYPFPEIISTPDPNSAAAQLIALLPPQWLGIPVIYFAVAIAFAFVLVVFL